MASSTVSATRGRRSSLRPHCLVRVAAWAALVLILFSSRAAYAAQVTLVWDPNTEPDLAGYKVYLGESSQVYQPSINVGLTTSYTVTNLQNGTVYYFAVTAYDSSGNESSFSAEINTTVVDTTPPVISAVAVPTRTFSGASITWTTNEPSDSQVEYGPTTAYGSATAVNVSLVTSHSMALSGLPEASLCHFRVRSRDMAGNLATSADFTFTTLDGTAPSVAVTAPAAGTSVSGTVSVTASATDNVGVVGVRFTLDGANLGAEDLTAPFSVSWDTTASLTGAHTLTAVARDAAGNVSVSAEVGLTVTNTSLRLSPQDTSLNINATNYSSDTVLTTYTWPDNRIANAVLLKFDLAALPAGAVVQDATLHLALVESDGAAESTYTVTAHKVVGKTPVLTKATGYTVDGVAGWTPNTCCYNNVPLAQADLSPAYATLAVDKAPGDKTWTITNMVQEWLADPATNVGLLLNSDPSKLRDRYRYFASMEHPDATRRPFLQVTHSLPAPDVTPPSVAVTAPAAGTSVSGTVSVTASATDDVGVVGVQFKLDGGSLGLEDTTSPYSASWNTSGATGSHTLTAVARDAAGNLATSAAVTVTVADTASPVVSGVTASALTASSATITWTTNEASDSQVEYGPTTAYGSATAVNVSLVTSHSMALSGLPEASLCHFRVRSRDMAGNLATSADFTFTTLDGTAPSVAVTAPAAGTSVSGTVSVTASATDKVGVVGVRFTLDGANLGAEDLTAPFSVSWDTTASLTGAHTLTAVARDAAGNVSVSAEVGLTVTNTSLRLSPQDTSLNINATNYSSDTVLTTYTWPDNRIANAVLLTFDLAALPAGAVVQDATLHLALVESDGAAESTYTVTAHKVVGKTPVLTKATGYTVDGVAGWTPNTCCYNNVPLAQADLSPAYATLAVDTAAGDKTWTITNMVQEWLADPATNVGLLLNSDASKLRDRYRYFASMEHPDATRRPFLQVTYFVPSTLDEAPPAVAITAPAAGATVSDTAPIEASATDDVGVTSVQFTLDGANLGAEVMAAPYVLYWDTTTVSDGAHTLVAVARDAVGHATTSAAVGVTVANGSFRLSPQDTSLNINATNYSRDRVLRTYTWPNYRVANVIVLKFDLASLPAGAVVQDATLHLALVESDGAAESTYTVTAHKVVGKNPVLTKATGYTVDGVAGWTPNACCYNNVPLAQADLSPAYATRAVDKVSGYKTWTITAMVQEWVANPTTNFGLLLNSDPSKPRDRYRYFASMEHPDPSLRPFLQINYSSPPLDETPPSVTISTPAPRATGSSTVTVGASATDNVGVVGVQFALNGAILGEEDTVAPYAISFDTTGVANGTHIFTATARDAAGNAAISCHADVVRRPAGRVWHRDDRRAGGGRHHRNSRSERAADLTGAAGQQATLRVTSNTMLTVTVKLLKPDGTQLTSSTAAITSFNLTTQTLPATGTYTIVIDPSKSNTGTVNIGVTSP